MLATKMNGGNLARRLGTFVAIIALGVLFAATAYAGIISYASGSYGAGGYYSTPGQAPRDWNRVYHQPGYRWCLYYEAPPGTINQYECQTSPYPNPFWWNHAGGYAYAWCQNVNDNSGTIWTCQTTN